MTESRHEQGYGPANDETTLKIKQYLAGAQPRDPKHPDEDWWLSEQEREAGRAGIEQTRAVSAEHVQPKPEPVGMSETRIILEAKHLQSIGVPLTPQQQRVLAKHYREQEQ